MASNEFKAYVKRWADAMLAQADKAPSLIDGLRFYNLTMIQISDEMITQVQDGQKTLRFVCEVQLSRGTEPRTIVVLEEDIEDVLKVIGKGKTFKLRCAFMVEKPRYSARVSPCLMVMSEKSARSLYKPGSRFYAEQEFNKQRDEMLRSYNEQTSHIAA